MAGFNSFEPLLRKYLREIKPTKILEWGTGRSTAIMAEECPLAKIYSLESDPNWYHKYFNVYKSSKYVNVILVPPKLLADIPRGWHKMFDLIFVDGLCDMRVACLRTASQILYSNGVAILHDSERTKYAEGVSLFDKVEESDGTLVMKKRDNVDYMDSNPDALCSCGHSRKEHNVKHIRALPEVKDCMFCSCEKFYPEVSTY